MGYNKNSIHSSKMFPAIHSDSEFSDQENGGKDSGYSDGDTDITKKETREDFVPALSASYRNILKHIGENPNREERLTKEVAGAVWEAVSPSGVGVVMEACHMCMVMRGVQKINSQTVTSCMLGAFRDDPKTRAEFLSLVKT